MRGMKDLFFLLSAFVLVIPLFAFPDSEQLSFDGLWPRSNFAKVCICAKLIWVDLEDLSLSQGISDTALRVKSYALYKEADELLVALHQVSITEDEVVSVEEWNLFYSILMHIIKQYDEVRTTFNDIHMTKVGMILRGVVDYVEKSYVR